MSDIDLATQQASLQQLLDEAQILSLATLNHEQQAEASLTPFVHHDGHLWVFVSQLSKHTGNLASAKQVSVLIHEALPANPFKTLRVAIQCQVALVDRESHCHVLDLMQDKLGETVALLRQLGDFCLFRLRPDEGQFVAGFGQAFKVNFADMSLAHIKPLK